MAFTPRHDIGNKSHHFDAFLKLTNVKGETVDDKHKDEIEILAFSWSMETPIDRYGSAGAAAGKVQVGELHITKQIDKATPALIKSVTTGDHIGDGTLTVRKAGGASAVEYLKIKFTDLFVSELHPYTHEDSPTVLEQVALTFKTFHVTYTSQNKDGGAGPGSDFGWDVAANKKL